MKRTTILLMGVLLAAVPTAGWSADDSEGKILRFGTMVGVNGVFLGTANPIRGINGGGRPWVLDEARGEVGKDGRLLIKVRGLIIPATEPGFGFNPAPFFLAAVSCLTVENFQVVEENVFTRPDDTKMLGDPRNGDAIIKADLLLPDPCIAPIVFITSPQNAWFSVTGGTFMGN